MGMNKENNSKTTLMSLGAAMLIAAMGVGAAVYALTLDSSEKKSAWQYLLFSQ